MTYSVITVCLNSGKTVKRTIDSVLGQSLAPKEYVFVDGGSTDNTREIIQEAISQVSEGSASTEFTVLSQTSKGGITEAWNIGLDTIRGDVVFILNSDDWYLPDTAEYVLSVFGDNRDVGIVLGGGIYVDGPDDVRGEMVYNRPFMVLPFAMAAIHPACFVRREVYRSIGKFEARYRVAADYEFIYRARKANVRFKVCRRTLVNVLKGGFAAQNRELARREVFEIGRKYCRLALLPYLAFFLRAALGR